MLARIYRPVDLEDVFGNERAKEALCSVLKKKSEDRPRAYLLHGLTGCGKTTLARWLAKALGAKKLGIVEMDMGTYSKKEDTEEILADAVSRPLQGDVKAFILDECHEVSAKAKSAMLKALEEAPPHVVYILCTNKVSKLPKELRNRCFSVEVQPLTLNETKKLLTYICEQENVPVSVDVIETIADMSEGCPREAISLLETIIDVPADKMLDTLSAPASTDAAAIDLCRALTEKTQSWKKVAAILANLQAEPEGVRLAVLGYCNAILLKREKVDVRIVDIMEHFKDPFFHDGKFRLTVACANACT